MQHMLLTNAAHAVKQHVSACRAERERSDIPYSLRKITLNDFVYLNHSMFVQNCWMEPTISNWSIIDPWIVSLISLSSVLFLPVCIAIPFAGQLQRNLWTFEPTVVIDVYFPWLHKSQIMIFNRLTIFVLKFGYIWGLYLFTYLYVFCHCKKATKLSTVIGQNNWNASAEKCIF